MPVYTYRGTNRAGASVSGEMTAASKTDLQNLLKRQQITASKMSEKGREFNVPTFGGGIDSKELAIFTRQFSVMIDAGLPLVQCLEILAGQQENKIFQKVLINTREMVEGGSTLSAAMKASPKVFDPLYTNMVEAGETGGILDTILQRLSAYIEKNVKLQRAGNADDADGVHHRRLDGALQLDVLFEVSRQPLQNGVENTARLARFHHVGVQRIENLGRRLHGGGQRRAAFHHLARIDQHFLKDLVFLLAGENLQTLHERQARVDHDRELARKDRQFLRVDAAAERGNVKFPALLAHLRSGTLLPLQKILQVGLAGCCHFTAHGCTGAVRTPVCIDRHNLPPQSVTLTREPSSFGWPAKLSIASLPAFCRHQREPILRD